MVVFPFWLFGNVDTSALIQYVTLHQLCSKRRIMYLDTEWLNYKIKKPGNSHVIQKGYDSCLVKQFNTSISSKPMCTLRLALLQAPPELQHRHKYFFYLDLFSRDKTLFHL